MAGDFDEIDDWIRGLENLGEELSAGEGIFRANEERYVAIARNVGGQVLLAAIPEGVDPQEWGERVSDFVDLVFSRLVGKGLEILYQGRTDEDPKRKGDIPITYEDVLEWVKAGVEDGGKDKTAIETNRGRTDEQIAYDVNTAIIQHRLGFDKKDYGAITARLEEWVQSRVLKGDFSDLLVIVLDAWQAAVAAAMEKDLADFADEAIRDAFR